MNRKYVESNIINSNPLVVDLASDYLNFLEKCSRSTKTQPTNTVLENCEDLFTGENAWLIAADESNN
jgi:hypothetical protein